MQIQVNSNNSVDVDDEMIEMARSIAQDSLGRFEDRLTRLEIHINDVNSHKSGSGDKRCQIEARPAGLPPVSATAEAATIDAATRAAVQKLERVLESTFGRLADQR